MKTTNRRAFITTGLAVGVGACTNSLPARHAEAERLTKELATLEAQVGGRVGVFAFSPTVAGAETVAYRADERFAMCSTFKWALVAQVLVLADRGVLDLSDELPFTQTDILEYAPVAKSAWAEGKRALSVEAWCRAAVEMSDNTAANELFARVGGAPAVTAFFASVGDKLTRMDRIEPELNTNLPSDDRDTTTPRGMAKALGATLTAEVLRPESRDKLVAWMVASPTGKDRLRAGFAPALRAGDKTGTCNHGACNDVAVVWRTTGEPLIVASYLSGSSAPLDDLLAAQRRVGALVGRLL